MTEEHFGSCDIVSENDTEFVLVFSEFGDDNYYPDNLNELLGEYEAGGEEWELIIVAALKQQGVNLEGVTFDPESDMLSAYSENKPALVQLAQLINDLLGDKRRLKKTLQYAIDLESQKPSLSVTVNAKGWVKCPRCRYQFKITDRAVWSGKRHISCGQGLTISNIG